MNIFGGVRNGGDGGRTAGVAVVVPPLVILNGVKNLGAD
jgi:hypothetical protein